MNKIMSVCLTFALLAFATASASASDPARVQEELGTFVGHYMEQCNRMLRPNRTMPSVISRDGKYVSTYIELDPRSVVTELYPASGQSFAYMAKITYVEHTYEAVAATEEAARNGVYTRVKSRRLTELPRYAGGKWEN